MSLKFAVIAVLGAILLAAGGFAVWLLSLPPQSLPAAATRLSNDEQASLLAAFKPPKRQRPLVAIVGINDATETTDYLMPYGILKRSGVVDVMALSTKAGPVQLYPALKVMPEGTLQSFDTQYPDGADYVIVPAMSRDDDPEVMAWLAAQAGKSATIIGVCAGAKVVAAAGLLNGRRGTTHWYYLGRLRALAPTVTYVPDRRLVADGNIITTTGISASMPMALTLIEAIAGRAVAETTAQGLGLGAWPAGHDSDAFRISRPFALTVLTNMVKPQERVAVPLRDGIDEVSLALVADAWSRTYRSKAVSTAATLHGHESLNGLRILPDALARDATGALTISLREQQAPADVLEATLRAIATRHGQATARIVATQLEYPWMPAGTQALLPEGG